MKADIPNPQTSEGLGSATPVQPELQQSFMGNLAATNIECPVFTQHRSYESPSTRKEKDGFGNFPRQAGVELSGCTRCKAD